MSKKKILFVNEASYMATGFSVIGHEIISRLYKSGKFEIAELGSYSRPGDPRSLSVPWQIYSVLPHPNDKEYQERYSSTHQAQFGSLKFEEACLDFNPDVVIDIRDHQMAEWEDRSPYRKYFKWIWMPMIDGVPQKGEWLDNYSYADIFLPACQFAKDVLEKEAPYINVWPELVRPGVNHEIFKPMDKQKCREELGVHPDANIILTVMRNQPRKLYRDLMDMFNLYLRTCEEKGKSELARKSYLYIHGSYPDVGWDFAKGLLETGLSSKVVFTKYCTACKDVKAMFFNQETNYCPKCGNKTLIHPNTDNGVTRETLAKIYNCGDAYVQFSASEGLSCCSLEAKACGVPLFGVDYSATAEQVNAPGGYPIAIERVFHETFRQTEQARVLPDNKDAVRKLIDFLSLANDVKAKIGKDAREDAMNYTFDRAAEIFIRAIDSCDPAIPWSSNKIPTPNLKDIPTNLSNTNFLDWCIINIMLRPDLTNSQWRHKMAKILDAGYELAGNQKKSITQKDILSMFIGIGNKIIHWEQLRLEKFYGQQKKEINWSYL